MNQPAVRHDLKIAGMGNAAGGFYEKVRIDGSGRVEGDVDCHELKISGSGSIHGNLKTGVFSVSGSASFKGGVQAQRGKTSGSADFGANASIKEFRVDGSASVEGSVSGDDISVRGTMTVQGDLQAEAFAVQGGFLIGGLLNAGRIDVRMYGDCQAREIGGEQISIRRKVGYFHKLFKGLFSITLETDMIEGDEIYLENTRAKAVRGNSVRIGPDCEIELVEYKTHFEQSPSAKIREARQI
jgi:cytoskeletal protein CcmA (bactofilin family)